MKVKRGQKDCGVKKLKPPDVRLCIYNLYIYFFFFFYDVFSSFCVVCLHLNVFDFLQVDLAVVFRTLRAIAVCRKSC